MFWGVLRWTILSCLITRLNMAVATPDPHKRPNIVLIIADDEDISLATPEVMPHLYETVGRHGKTFTHFFAPVSICCPSRVSLLRAQYAHNHNVTYVALPWGSWTKFNEFGYNDHWLPVFLQNAGYDTRYIGKLMNGQTVDLATSLPAKGWTDSDFLLDPYTYTYTNAAFSRNGGASQNYPGLYSTDLIANKSLAQLDEALKTPNKPFFLGIAPIGPHAESLPDCDFCPPRPAERHAELFANDTLPQSASFNPEEPGGASWVQHLPLLNQTQVDYLNSWYRNRKRAVQSVDELVGAVVRKLEKAGILDNTYIIYTADNGYALGTHRRQPGKCLPYEEDIRVPLVVRGPGVASRSVDEVSSYNIPDLGATILNLAGASADYPVDGRIIPFSDTLSPGPGEQDEHHTVAEYWIYGIEEGKYAAAPHRNTTYRALRVVEDGQSWAYHVWCTGERELYNMKSDELQLHNLLQNNPALESRTQIDRLVARLDALLLVLKTCVGQTCRLPWASIFPHGQVDSLEQALQPQYDRYFEGLPKVTYAHCDLGFHAALEYPVWTDDLSFSAFQAILSDGSLKDDSEWTTVDAGHTLFD